MILQEIEANKKRLKDLKDIKTVEVDFNNKQKEHATAAKRDEGNMEWCKIQVSLFFVCIFNSF